MPNTYTQIYIQIVFTVKGRQNLLHPKHREELHKYITGIVKQRNQKLLSIFCMPDHVHMLVSLKPSLSISDLVRDIKVGSTNFINAQNWIRGKFQWQEGFGAFSYSWKDIGNVINYIENQEQHHKQKTFKEEYLDFLQDFSVAYQDEYLFDWVEDANKIKEPS